MSNIETYLNKLHQKNKTHNHSTWKLLRLCRNKENVCIKWKSKLWRDNCNNVQMSAHIPYIKGRVSTVISWSKSQVLWEMKRRSYHASWETVEMARKLGIQRFQKVEKGSLWRGTFSAKEKMCHIWGWWRVWFGCIVGHGHGVGDISAWKEKTASSCGVLKVNVSFRKQWEKQSISEKRRPHAISRLRLGGTGFESYFCQVITLWPWARYLSILSPGFLTSAMIVIPTS